MPLENGLPLGIGEQASYAETEITTDAVVTFVSDGVVEARAPKANSSVSIQWRR